ncbi:MAG: long-chain fatty acid--CoA ligase [Thermoanaerobaculia bacterium]|nr:long-chain fatty acid--CoA ligase [Thermoanaerobaculia bacterium]MBP7812605.1 long-chain fatty acid--CoA ligase [Thermoanaerobaculia bacterium]MBP8844799.1 long-chain fatty acid--CoA ligase [Thermoanaerobaculia bacterium]HPA95094.1 fatty acid--CoA ligase family protein [Thermoanaerobaculia bacterium]HQN38814.1 fatty acid--CoA ligase family protein [Thermoanaerobaculia bacterium]
MSTTPPDPLLQAFDRLAATRAERPLVAGLRAVATVGEIDRVAAALALRLAAAGWEEETLVGLSAANGPAFLAGFLALRRARFAPVLLDAGAPSTAQGAVLGLLGARGRLAAPGGWAFAPERWELTTLRPAVPAGVGREIGAVMLTSGTTGSPRGVVAPSAALVADDAQLAAVMGLAAADRMVAAVPFSHAYGLKSLAVPALVRGSLLLSAETPSPLAPLHLATAGEATFLPTVPAFLAAVARLAEPPALPASLRLVVSAGAPLSAEVSAAFRERCGRPVHVFYGASESGGITYDRPGGAAERGTVGEPIPGVEVELVGEEGRVAVRSAAVADRYLPEPGPELAGGRYLTGDLGVWKGSELALCGRVDDLLIVKGKKVDPREIERLLAALPGVREAAVFGVPAPGGAGRVVGAVIAVTDGELDYATVTGFCRERLADYQVPRALALVSELPRTARGKLDRTALLALLDTSARAGA